MFHAAYRTPVSSFVKQFCDGRRSNVRFLSCGSAEERFLHLAERREANKIKPMTASGDIVDVV
jgi:hypothetical protein